MAINAYNLTLINISKTGILKKNTLGQPPQNRLISETVKSGQKLCWTVILDPWRFFKFFYMVKHNSLFVILCHISITRSLFFFFFLFQYGSRRENKSSHSWVIPSSAGQQSNQRAAGPLKINVLNNHTQCDDVVVGGSRRSCRISGSYVLWQLKPPCVSSLRARTDTTHHTLLVWHGCSPNVEATAFIVTDQKRVARGHITTAVM